MNTLIEIKQILEERLDKDGDAMWAVVQIEEAPKVYVRTTRGGWTYHLMGDGGENRLRTFCGRTVSTDWPLEPPVGVKTRICGLCLRRVVVQAKM